MVVSEELLTAIEFVESNFNSEAVGDNGKAVGSFQIHKIFVDDVNRILKNHKYTYEDRLDRVKSREMARIYLEYYANNYKKNTGRNVDNEVLSRIFNGGPHGYNNNMTISYWAKVKDYLEKYLC